MFIPTFPLPSNLHTEIKFDMPSVEMAMKYCNVSAEQEESMTTEYLNDLQERGPTFIDSKTWTAQDRRTALWWVFTNSRIDTMLSASYECKHCGDLHHVDVDMKSLINDFEVLPGIEDEVVQTSVKGEPYTVRIVPLNGEAMTNIELFRSMLPPDDDPKFKAEWINLRIIEIAHQLRFENEPEDFTKAAEYRYSQLRIMDLEYEFQTLVAKIQLFNRRNHHGLDIGINKGVTVLNLPPHKCKSQVIQEGEAVLLTPLHMPFRASLFLPAFRSQWLGFADE